MKSVETQEKAKEEAKKMAEAKVDVDVFLKELGITKTVEEMIIDYENKIKEVIPYLAL